MYLDIKPQRYIARDCFDDQIASIADWYGIDFELMFSEHWGFSFVDSKNNVCLGRRIQPNFGNKIQLLEIYHGVQLIIHKYKSSAKKIDLIKNELAQNIPVLVSMDSFDCPWEQGYQKYSIPHTFIIVGITEDYFFCTDANCNQYAIRIKIADFINKFEEIITITILKKMEPTINFNNIIIKAILKNKNAFKEMRIFADTLNTEFDMKKELRISHNTVWWRVPIFYHLSSIIRGRQLFAKTIEYIANKNDNKELSLVVPYFNQLSEKWSNIRAFFMKASNVQDSNFIVKKTSEKIHILANEEEIMADKLLKICSRKVEYKSVNIDLDSYFNNICLIPSQKKENYELYNNINALNRPILVDSNYYQAISILICNTNHENIINEITFNYSNGTKQKKQVLLTGTHSSQPLFGEKLISIEDIISITYTKQRNYFNDIPFYEIKIVLDPSKILSSIILPNHNGLHIFSVKLF